MTTLTRMRLAVYDLQITVQTPVHVGSGETLRADADFVVEPTQAGAQVHVIDVDAALERMSDAEIARIQRGSIAKALDVRTRIMVTRRKYQTSQAPGEIRQHVSLADGTPYLPGSSLKGTLRTALLVRLVGEADAVIRANAAAVEAFGVVPSLSHEPVPANRDLLRLLRISDLAPERPSSALILVRIEARSLRGSQRGTGRGIPIWCEALAPGARLRGTLTVESGSPLARALDKSQLTAFNRLLPETLPAFAVRVARYEQESYQAAGGTAPALFAEIERGGGRGAGGVWSNVGWGSGWQVKTVATALPEQQWEQAAEQVRARFHVFGPVPRPFPSSRRVALTERGETPMGWVQIAYARREQPREA